MEKGQTFEELLNTKLYQVFLFTCPGSIPFNFATHPWFVLNNQGKISRWEVLFRKTPHPTSWGHLYKDFLPPTQGIEIIPYYRKYFWQGNLVGFAQGDENSFVRHMIELIENSPTTYPYRDKYFLTGPNSNTYVQWVLTKFPEVGVTLPTSAIGKNTEIKR